MPVAQRDAGALSVPGARRPLGPISSTFPSFPPSLPVAENDSVGYEIISVGLTNKVQNISSDVKKQIHENGVLYYIQDGFTWQILNWSQTVKKYPEIVKNRAEFLEWLENENRLLKSFDPVDPKLQPVVKIYEIQNN